MAAIRIILTPAHLLNPALTSCPPPPPTCPHSSQPARSSPRLPGMQLPGLHSLPSTSLPTDFRLHHHVEEGEPGQVCLLGHCLELGAWDHGCAVPMAVDGTLPCSRPGQASESVSAANRIGCS
jgi:hypothetical protein